MKEPTTVLDPRIGDTLICPGCDCPLTLTAMGGWCGPHVGCVNGTVHTDWILTVFSNPAQQGPLPALRPPYSWDDRLPWERE